MVTDTVSCYMDGRYSGCICTVLPLIEGAIWAFADYYNFIEKNLFSVTDAKKHLKLKNGKTVKDFTIGDLLKRSELSDFFDAGFIDYYCNELYNERNPILHGKDISGFNQVNSAKKLLTFDFLTERMENYFKSVYERQMDGLLSEPIINKLLARKALTKQDHKTISVNSAKLAKERND
jgi:hypothetical protein